MVITDGLMNARDFIGMAESLLHHPHCQPDVSVVFDHTALEFHNVSVEDLEQIRAFHLDNQERIGSGKSAIVVGRGLSGDWHQLWSQGKKIRTKNRVQIFENCADAISWLKEDK
ncbi:MAG TPA: hypothetical protein PL125_05365 [Candidatus Omnitrophota bacterium]|nr:hypothetical protein [Candidatus Omnitrophota bacterium]HPT39604.1 hypothetical protein [Candidatus Omnitrophota bacterium]